MLQRFNCFDLWFCPWEVLQYLRHLQIFSTALQLTKTNALPVYCSGMKVVINNMTILTTNYIDLIYIIYWLTWKNNFRYILSSPVYITYFLWLFQFTHVCQTVISNTKVPLPWKLNFKIRIGCKVKSGTSDTNRSEDKWYRFNYYSLLSTDIFISFPFKDFIICTICEWFHKYMEAPSIQCGKMKYVLSWKFSLSVLQST